MRVLVVDDEVHLSEALATVLALTALLPVPAAVAGEPEEYLVSVHGDAADFRRTVTSAGGTVEDVFGRHQAVTRVISGVYAEGYAGDPQFAALTERIAAGLCRYGFPPPRTRPSPPSSPPIVVFPSSFPLSVWLPQ